MFDHLNYEIVNTGRQEKTDFAMRDTYVEFDEFKSGLYYMYVCVYWNGKAKDKNFSVNCYAPSRCIWLGDETSKW